jgi:hypothetical protein
MILTPEQLNDFKSIYKQLYGLELSPKEANELGNKLITIVRLIYKPIKNDNYNDNKTYENQHK